MENITPSPDKNYLTQPPFFISDAQGYIEILRPADFWSNPEKWKN